MPGHDIDIGSDDLNAGRRVALDLVAAWAASPEVFFAELTRTMRAAGPPLDPAVARRIGGLIASLTRLVSLLSETLAQEHGEDVAAADILNTIDHAIDELSSDPDDLPA